jgi:glycyl-tRNA synthetase
MADENNLLEKIVALCKRRGFIFPGSEIYGGLAGTWDYGPAGSMLKKNLKDLWWKEMVQLRDDIVGVDAAIMMNPKAWEASGHVEGFTDPLIECKICHKRFRPDKEDEVKEHESSHKGEKVEWTEPKNFNLLVKTYLGVTEDSESEIFLRGEITNGVQVNFKNVLDSTRVRIPFGIAQIGKAFRNEITPGNFTFRSREFEQMEVQFYIKPDSEEGKKWFEEWKQNRMDFYLSLGISKEKLRFKDHEKLAHYAKAACDIEYEFPWGFDEIMGIHNRGDWDLSRHQQFSGQDMTYRDPISGEVYTPWDIETSAGVDRCALAILTNAYTEDEGRVYMKFDPRLAPYKVAVFPLLANKPELVERAKKIYLDCKENFMVAWDERGNIGKRYAAQDEIGTPFCVTVDFQTLEDETVTVRFRDSAKQERVKVSELLEFLEQHINGRSTRKTSNKTASNI